MYALKLDGYDLCTVCYDGLIEDPNFDPWGV